MRPSWVEIDLGAIRHNAAALAAVAAPAKLCAVVKADGYGHGDVPVAEAALDGGAEWLAVALLEEGIRLREAGIDAPILLLSEPVAGDAESVVQWNLSPTAYSRSFVEALAGFGSTTGVHLKIDTGMHRVGVDPSEAVEVAEAVAEADALELEGVWTHFAVAETDAEFTKRQIGALNDFVGRLSAEGIRPAMVHAANSAGTLAFPDSHFDLVRCGIALYGLRPAPGIGADVDLRPAMAVKSSVSMTRRLAVGERLSYGRRRPLPAESTVATVPIGYADGLARRLSDGGEVLIRDERRPFAGTVTMDHVVVDCGDLPVEAGDEVVVMGRQGDLQISADDWAGMLGTINYEIVCDFGPRLPRRYLE